MDLNCGVGGQLKGLNYLNYANPKKTAKLVVTSSQCALSLKKLFCEPDAIFVCDVDVNDCVCLSLICAIMLFYHFRRMGEQ